MKSIKTPLTDEYVESLAGLSYTEPKIFFYERLISRLENQQLEKEWAFPLKPVWMVCTLTFFLIANTIILTHLNSPKKTTEKAVVQNFAAAYDQNILSY